MAAYWWPQPRKVLARSSRKSTSHTSPSPGGKQTDAPFSSPLSVSASLKPIVVYSFPIIISHASGESVTDMHGQKEGRPKARRIIVIHLLLRSARCLRPSFECAPPLSTHVFFTPSCSCICIRSSLTYFALVKCNNYFRRSVKLEGCLPPPPGTDTYNSLALTL